MGVGDDGKTDRAVADFSNGGNHLAPVAIGNARIDNDYAFRPDDEPGVADTATIGLSYFAAIADKGVDVSSDANRFEERRVTNGNRCQKNTDESQQPHRTKTLD